MSNGLCLGILFQSNKWVWRKSIRIRKLIAFHDSDEEIRRKSYHC